MQHKVRGIVNSEDSNIKIHNEGIAAAKKAAQEFVDKHGEPMYCGFAWVDVAVGRTNSKLAKQLEAVGFRKSHRAKTMTLWDPAQHRGQSMDCKEQGAYAYADTLRAAGIEASAGSRAD